MAILSRNLGILLDLTKQSTRSVSQACGMNVTAIQSIMSGRVASPRAENLIRIAEFFGVTPDDLISLDLSQDTPEIRDLKNRVKAKVAGVDIPIVPASSPHPPVSAPAPKRIIASLQIGPNTSLEILSDMPLDRTMWVRLRKLVDALEPMDSLS